ncbi:hypothetical protein BDV37DRAFT_166970 [Aspergillus pseudonomiae]|uniref:Uncharacterized protein n=1 Tax=Aspergillus pseudonomiae TaxID=1506151 RepID=A0A5N7D6I5_9EURO|nr:uncharacterized protein BDV37DRAFT_166970 [Aspergillus pseudonomiae]KAE8402015.1 hypothetical protein BDV37DRAFT_166970 [Aspergillus pseudonomiae]
MRLGLWYHRGELLFVELVIFFLFLPCFFVCGVGDLYSEYEHCITSTGCTLGVLMVILRQWFYDPSRLK